MLTRFPRKLVLHRKQPTHAKLLVARSRNTATRWESLRVSPETANSIDESFGSATRVHCHRRMRQVDSASFKKVGKQKKQSTKLTRSPCVSSVFATIMRRTCIVMRTVLRKTQNSQRLLELSHVDFVASNEKYRVFRQIGALC